MSGLEDGDGPASRPLGLREARGAWRPAASIHLKPWKPWDVGSAPQAQISPPSTLWLFLLLPGPSPLRTPPTPPMTMSTGTSFSRENTHPAEETSCSVPAWQSCSPRPPPLAKSLAKIWRTRENKYSLSAHYVPGTVRPFCMSSFP